MSLPIREQGRADETAVGKAAADRISDALQAIITGTAEGRLTAEQGEVMTERVLRYLGTGDLPGPGQSQVSITHVPADERAHKQGQERLQAQHDHKMQAALVYGMVGAAVFAVVALIITCIGVIATTRSPENLKSAWNALIALISALLGFLAGRFAGNK